MKILKSGVEIAVQNVVASAKLGHSIDLDAVVVAFPEVEYRPEVFPGLAFKLKKPKTCTLIFSSGRMVCTGAKSVKDARKAVLKVVGKLKREGILVRLSKPYMNPHGLTMR